MADENEEPLPVSDLAELVATKRTFKAHRGQLGNRHTAKPQQIAAAVRAVEWVILTATRQQAGWARLRLKALRELGQFLLRTPYLKGCPPKVSTADTLPSLEKLGIKDRRIAWRAIQVAKVDEDLFQRYLTTDEPTEKGLHRQARCVENYSESEATNVVSFDPEFGGARRFARGGYLGLATTGNPEWYTPSTIFEALGCRFDIDVASPGADIVPWIPADYHFTIADNGLEQDWGNAYVFMNPPFNREYLSQWLEKFQHHANGICLIGDRTSVGSWQEVCGNADLILLVNKKINFISPTTGATGNNTLGSTLVAYGKRAVNALMNAARQGLGTLFKPCPVPTSHAEAEDPDVAERSSATDRSSEARRETRRENESERYWLTPPDKYAALNAEFQFDFDACPFPRPDNFDPLEVAWGRCSYVNPPFRPKDGDQGPTAFARKAIEENKLGKTVVLMLPVQNYVNLLLEAGAELRSAGRVKWLEADTRQPLSSPSPINCFVLRGNRKF
jgi:hypothetical protein